MEERTIQSKEELAFVVFVVEAVAMRRSLPPAAVLDAFTKKSRLLHDYILPGYEALHTQGRDYIVEDILAEAAFMGVEL